MLPNICIEDFIRYTESLFDGFLSTGGEKINDYGEEKYQLFNSRALRAYLKNCEDGYSPNFTNNNISLYLNRCRYYIYPEKRKNEYKDKKGNAVDPPEVFSGKCVNLFYELSGVEFYFLRITPLDECTDATYVEFRKMQQDYLVNLFEMTVKYLCSFQKKETPLTIFELKNFWELLYRKYRYQLSRKFLLVFNLQHSLFLKEELFSWLTSVTTAYREMRNIVKTVYDNEWEYIIHENNNPTQNMQDRYVKTIKRLKKLIRQIQMILKANHLKDINMDILDILTPEDKDELLNYVKQNPRKTFWKVYFIDKLIEKYYSNRFHSFMSSVIYLNNYKDAIKEYASICGVMWGIISMMSDKIEVADYFINGNIFKLIKEIDEMYWFLKQQGMIAIE